MQARAEKEFSQRVTALDGGRPQERQSELARQLGLTARAGIEGVLALPGMAADAACGVVNTGLPSTDLMCGACPGYEVDHIQPLCAVGPDTRANMPWLSVAAHRVKTRQDLLVCRFLRKMPK